jgi:hypothetical protein
VSYSSLSKTTNRGIGAVIALWVTVLVLNVAWWGFIGWAIYKLVTHFAG